MLAMVKAMRNWFSVRTWPSAMRRYSKDKPQQDRKSTRLNSSHLAISYAVFCLKKKKTTHDSAIIHLDIYKRHQSIVDDTKFLPPPPIHHVITNSSLSLKMRYGISNHCITDSYS